MNQGVAIVTGRMARPMEKPLQRLGTAMMRHSGAIRAIQWVVVVFYVVLVAVPAFLPLPPDEAHVYDNLVLFAQFVFWGIWWPFVIVSVMFLGRLWCGVFCPEGTLTEWASRRGVGRPVPRWMKWGGWPFVAFVLTTVYGQMVSVYGYAKPALLILGGSTIAAMGVGLLYGRGRRVWCRHLCPVSGVFGLLARIAPLHFRVNRVAWDSARAPSNPVVCAPLVDIRRMKGGAECHMCGRCADHRGAVALAARPAGAEVIQIGTAEAQPWEVRLLVFGMIGVAAGAFQWSASPWLVQIKQDIATWLVDQGHFALLNADAPWWLLTHYPDANDLFSWLDGLLLLAYIAATALAVGGWVSVFLRAAGSVLPGDHAAHARRLAYSLVPVAGIGIFLGLSAMTVTALGAEGVRIPGLAVIRALLLGLAATWSLVLTWKQLEQIPVGMARRAMGMAGVVAALLGCTAPWILLLFVW